MIEPLMSKPQSKDLSHHLSDEANSRNPSLLKEAFIHSNKPGMVSLGGGLPLPSLFPWDALQAKSLEAPFPQGIEADILSADSVLNENITKEGGSHPKDIPLKTALQYGHSIGDPNLIGFIKEHTEMIHNVGFADWNVILTAGNTFSWDAILRTFTNRGDVILTEEFSFASALETAHANGVTTVGVKMDLHGIIPEALDEQLSKWVGTKPKFLYTIPTGQNPAGSSLSGERRQAIYKIIQKHDLLLIEDEPYYFLQMPEYKPGGHAAEKLSHDEFIKSLVPSFLNFDTDGRVIRLDSFSKVLAPGTRIAWVVAQERFIERLCRLVETTSQACAGFSTALTNGLLQRWGQSGYLDWLLQLRATYTTKRDISSDAIKEYLPKGLYDFCDPVAGMFFWVKLDARKHKKYEELGRNPSRVETQVYEDGIEKNVLLVPGHWFAATQKTTPPQPEISQSEEEKNAIYFRGTFASVSKDQLVEAIRRWSEVVKESFHQ